MRGGVTLINRNIQYGGRKIRSSKHFRLDSQKISRAHKLPGAGSETETIERALNLVITERKQPVGPRCQPALLHQRHS